MLAVATARPTGADRYAALMTPVGSLAKKANSWPKLIGTGQNPAGSDCISRQIRSDGMNISFAPHSEVRRVSSSGETRSG